MIGRRRRCHCIGRHGHQGQVAVFGHLGEGHGHRRSGGGGVDRLHGHGRAGRHVLPFEQIGGALFRAGRIVEGRADQNLAGYGRHRKTETIFGELAAGFEVGIEEGLQQFAGGTVEQVGRSRIVAAGVVLLGADQDIPAHCRHSLAEKVARARRRIGDFQQQLARVPVEEIGRSRIDAVHHIGRSAHQDIRSHGGQAPGEAISARASLVVRRGVEDLERLIPAVAVVGVHVHGFRLLARAVGVVVHARGDGDPVFAECGHRSAETVAAFRSGIVEILHQLARVDIHEKSRAAAVDVPVVAEGSDQHLVVADGRQASAELVAFSRMGIDEGAQQEAGGAVEEIDHPGVDLAGVFERGPDQDIFTDGGHRETEEIGERRVQRAGVGILDAQQPFSRDPVEEIDSSRVGIVQIVGRAADQELIAQHCPHAEAGSVLPARRRGRVGKPVRQRHGRRRVQGAQQPAGVAHGERIVEVGQFFGDNQVGVGQAALVLAAAQGGVTDGGPGEARGIGESGRPVRVGETVPVLVEDVQPVRGAGHGEQVRPGLGHAVGVPVDVRLAGLQAAVLVLADVVQPGVRVVQFVDHRPAHPRGGPPVGLGGGEIIEQGALQPHHGLQAAVDLAVVHGELDPVLGFGPGQAVSVLQGEDEIGEGFELLFVLGLGQEEGIAAQVGVVPDQVQEGRRIAVGRIVPVAVGRAGLAAVRRRGGLAGAVGPVPVVEDPAGRAGVHIHVGQVPFDPPADDLEAVGRRGVEQAADAQAGAVREHAEGAVAVARGVVDAHGAVAGQGFVVVLQAGNPGGQQLFVRQVERLDHDERREGLDRTADEIFIDVRIPRARYIHPIPILAVPQFQHALVPRDAEVAIVYAYLHLPGELRRGGYRENLRRAGQLEADGLLVFRAGRVRDDAGSAARVHQGEGHSDRHRPGGRIHGLDGQRIVVGYRVVEVAGRRVAQHTEPFISRANGVVV